MWNKVKQLADNRDTESLAVSLRRKRFEHVLKMITVLPKPVKILDVGGTEAFWDSMELNLDDLQVTILNKEKHPVSKSNFTSVAGDARDLKEFQDSEFDIVFSNSVIEHVGKMAEQKSMADEVQRVGKYYFVQTPNKFFPIEPHFVFPLFQFFPLWLQRFLLMNFALGYRKTKCSTRAEADVEIFDISLLSGRSFRKLFPEAKMEKEKLYGLVKSYMAIKTPAE